MKYSQTKKCLNQAVADLSQLSALIHQTHWYMRGDGFLFLHPKMDEFRDAVEEHLDEIAERLITMDGAPYSTLEEFASISKITLKPTTYDVSIQTRFEALVTAFRYLAELMGKIIEIADNENEPSAADIATTIKEWYEKQIWMLQAELGQAPKIDA